MSMFVYAHDSRPLVGSLSHFATRETSVGSSRPASPGVPVPDEDDKTDVLPELDMETPPPLPPVVVEADRDEQAARAVSVANAAAVPMRTPQVSTRIEQLASVATP
jgi:hypothetical protein